MIFKMFAITPSVSLCELATRHNEWMRCDGEREREQKAIDDVIVCCWLLFFSFVCVDVV